MSSLVVKVQQIESIKPHPNADLLEIAQVSGWLCVVKKGSWHVGDRCVYFPPDTVLPVKWTDEFGVTNYCSIKQSDPTKARIRCAKIRGEASFGLVVEPPAGLDDWTIGQDVAAYYNAEKYDPPIKMTAGDAEADHPMFPKYTDLENIRNFPNILVPGETVVVTEKIDGTNCRIGIIDGVHMAGSRQLRRKESVDGLYWMPWTIKPIADLLEYLAENSRVVILYGEIYGPGVQSVAYGEKQKTFRAFDLYMDGKYLSYGQFLAWCEYTPIPMVPVLGIGPYSFEWVQSLSRGKAFQGDHKREGVVIKPLTEREDPAIGRVVLKLINDDVLLDTKRQDFTDQ